MGRDATRTQDERLLFSAPASSPPAAERAPVVEPPLVLPRPSAGRWPALARAAHRAFESELERGHAFVFVPVFMAAGALAYFSLSQEPGFAPLLLGAGVLTALALVSRGRPLLRAALLAAVMTMAGMLAGKVETWRAETQMLGAEITTRLTARVARVEHQASGRVRLTLDVLATERPTLRYAPERVRATARAVPESLRPGHTVQGVVRLMPPSGPARPQSYDFAFRSYFDGIGASGFFLSGPEQVAAARAATVGETMAAWVEGWRARMANRITAQIGGSEGAIAAALITGVRAGIPEEINEALRITGLYHVIAISGLHMALVGGTVMVAMRAIFALAPAFSARRPVKKYAAAAALAATAFYLFVSGMGIAAQRSFTMLGVMLLAVIFDRAALTMRNLAISAIIILAVAPHEVIGPSFQMSFAATAALVAAYAAWTRHRESRASKRRPPRPGALAATARTGIKYAAGISMTSIVAGLATALFTAWHFQQVAPLGLAANLAAMPFVSVIVMPMAVLASLLMPFGLDGPPLQLMGLGIAAMNTIAIWLAERSVFDATGAIPLSAVLVLTAALAILTMAGSALRWAAAPLLVAGVALLATREMPDVLVSEDARLVAMRLADGRIAVNRDRPRAFTLQNWLRALDSHETVRPRKASPEQEPDMTVSEIGENTFSCSDGLCAARHHGGAIVVHAQDAERAATACAHASLIVIDDATALNPCAHGTATVVTKRDLARQGSAEIVFRRAPPQEETHAIPGARSRPQIRFAIKEPYRPWHQHRRFSREARGLAPYQRPQQTQAPETEATTGG